MKVVEEKMVAYWVGFISPERVVEDITRLANGVYTPETLKKDILGTWRINFQGFDWEKLDEIAEDWYKKEKKLNKKRTKGIIIK